MHRIELRLTEDNGPRTCVIAVGQGIVPDIGSLLDYSRYTMALIVADANVPAKFATAIETALPLRCCALVLSMGEERKTLASVERIWKALHESGCDRKSLVVTVGGGVIGDVAGFAASTYMRGIDFLHVPTTVASQADAGVGGKTGFNFGGIKNLIGAFTQPVAVVIDVDTLASLPQREYISGFAEIIKHGLIENSAYFRLATSKKPLEFDRGELVAILDQSCRIKASVVAADEREAGVRRVLNFGHTVGHAIESLSHETTNPLLHGEAVSIGMVAEARMAHSVGLLTAGEYATIVRSLSSTGLPTAVGGLTTDALVERMKPDKKNEGGKVNFTLLQGVGKAAYNQQVPHQAVLEALRQVVY